MKIIRLISIVLVALIGAASAQAPEPILYGYRILETYPHARDAFTQGLFFHDGALYESTGQYGQSSLRQVDLTSGDVMRRTDLPQSFFGEGATLADGDIFMLSWREGSAFRFDAEDFALKNSYSYKGEGWGLTYDGESLVMSDGTPQLRFIDPANFAEQRRVEVTLRGKPLKQLNELEWIDGAVYANVWKTNALVRIDPETGVVTSIVDLRGLLEAEDIVPGETDVLNGVAHAGEDGVLYVTGKYWPKLFKIELVELTN
ncbi:glutaminyl-peptide cyclotransferase [Marinicaulis aureus]|uniref:Glutaminyl-peptide cyclotransferase n=1 Tax=Hyphococcus aureus TaxID=2666033 RepID=A0ABW1KWF1_9PROT